MSCSSTFFRFRGDNEPVRSGHCPGSIAAWLRTARRRDQRHGYIHRRGRRGRGWCTAGRPRQQGHHPVRPQTKPLRVGRFRHSVRTNRAVVGRTQLLERLDTPPVAAPGGNASHQVRRFSKYSDGRACVGQVPLRHNARPLMPLLSSRSSHLCRDCPAGVEVSSGGGLRTSPSRACWRGSRKTRGCLHRFARAGARSSFAPVLAQELERRSPRGRGARVRNLFTSSDERTSLAEQIAGAHPRSECTRTFRFCPFQLETLGDGKVDAIAPRRANRRTEGVG